MKRNLLLLMLLISISVSAQDWAVKTNLLYDATATVNLGTEIGLSPKWTLDVSGNYNGWNLGNNKKLKHWMVQPEVRYWLCERFNGHFFGAHLMGGQYNVGGIDFPFGMLKTLKDYRYEGDFYGAGIVYGYQWLLGKRWNLEAAIGVGYIGTDNDKYDCPKCGDWLGSSHKNYYGVTKAAISIIYIIK